MRILRLADPEFQTQSQTPLGESLVQLKADRSEPLELGEKQADETEWSSWHDSWHANHDQITRKLSLIEAELDRLVGPGPEPPSLSVFEEHPVPAPPAH